MLALDLFEDPAPTVEQVAERNRWYAGLTRQRFEANYRRFHDRAPEVLQGRSDELLAGIAAQSARIIHVDGSHSFDAVTGDLEEACRIASANAVLIFDDITTTHTPGVAAAVWGLFSTGGSCRSR